MKTSELLKEVGEPTCWMTPDGEGWRLRTKPPETDTKLGWMEFYTSDQLAAALEEMNGWRNQAHQSQSAFDRLQDQLTRAEQRGAEWQPISTAPKDGRELILLLTPSNWPQVAYSNTWWISGFSMENKPTHWMPLPKAPDGASS